MKKIALHWKILIAMILGVIFAVLSGKYGWNDFTGDWIDPFGKIFINGLKLIAVPLVLQEWVIHPSWVESVARRFFCISQRRFVPFQWGLFL
jgi:L-cystine uptake protein TcyP (sodium:dicarboxylate symporter family)